MNFNRTSFQTRVGASEVVARLPAGCCLGRSQSAWVRLWGDLSGRDPRGSWQRGGPHPHQAPAHELWGGAFLSPGRHAPVHSYPGCPRPWGQGLPELSGLSGTPPGAHAPQLLLPPVAEALAPFSSPLPCGCLEACSTSGLSRSPLHEAPMGSPLVLHRPLRASTHTVSSASSRTSGSSQERMGEGFRRV